MLKKSLLKLTPHIGLSKVAHLFRKICPHLSCCKALLPLFCEHSTVWWEPSVSLCSACTNCSASIKLAWLAVTQILGWTVRLHALTVHVLLGVDHSFLMALYHLDAVVVREHSWLSLENSFLVWCYHSPGLKEWRWPWKGRPWIGSSRAHLDH